MSRKSRFGAGDAHHLLFGEREEIGKLLAFGDRIEAVRQPRFDDSANQFRRRRFETQRLDRPVARHVNRVVQPVLDIAVERRDEAVPQAALGEDQETEAVDLVHHLHDAGEKRLGDLVGIVAAASEQQVFELIEGHDDRRLQRAEHFHQHLEQREHEVLPGGRTWNSSSAKS